MKDWLYFSITFLFFSIILATIVVCIRSLISHGFLEMSLSIFFKIVCFFLVLMCSSLLFSVTQERVFHMKLLYSHITTSVLSTLLLIVFQLLIYQLNTIDGVIIPTVFICTIVNLGVYMIRVNANKLGKISLTR